MSKSKRTSGTKGTKTTDTNGAPGELEALRLPELQARYRDVVGETTKSPNRKFLIGRITEVLAARPESQVPEASPDENVGSELDESAEAAPASEPTEEEACTPAGPSAVASEIEKVLAAQPESQEPAASVAESAAAAPAAETTEDQVGSPASPPTDAPPREAAPETASSAEPPKEKKTRGRFAAMSITDLQALYLEKVGRPSGSSHRGYLVWKIREAEKGRITVGPVQARPRTATGESRDMKVLPLSLESTTVEKMDAAWRAKGIKTRAEFLRKAIGSYLTQLGASEEAALFTGE